MQKKDEISCGIRKKKVKISKSIFLKINLRMKKIYS